MSLQDVLDGARGLTRQDQVRLLHLLVDEVARPDLPSEDILRRALVLDAVHNPSPECWAVIQQAMDELYNGKFTG